jgi:hypothetical protein
MKTFTSKIRQTRARWLLFYGVLFGLLFSSGEGIQLMPFPVSAESKVSNLNASSRSKNSKSYAFSVFSSRSSFTLLKTKFQKDPNQYPSGEAFTPDFSESREKFRLSAGEDFQAAIFTRSFVVKNPKSKRAPPII